MRGRAEPGNSGYCGSFQPKGRKGQGHVAATVVSLTTYIYSSRNLRPWRGNSLFLDSAKAPRHKNPRFGAGLGGSGLSPCADTHHQARLQEAGPEKIRAPESNTEKKMFAVFKTGGKQYRVAAEDMLKVDKIKGEPGEIIEFGEVLVVGGDSVTLGAPMIAGATVAAEVVEQGRGPKVIAFKKRRRKNSRRKRGFRQEFTLLRITEILTDGNKPSKTAKRKAERTPAAVEASAPPEVSAAPDEATEHAAAKKPKSRAKAPADKAKKPSAKKKTEK
jgi:large subunit ribosomal protein L21